MADCSTVTTPMTAGLRLTKPDGAQLDAEREFMANMPYASAVGALLYLAMCTRPDIAYAVSVLCRFLAFPARAHWDAVKHLFRYLQATKDLCLVYRRADFDAKSLFVAYSDADHAGSVDTGRSTGGYALIMAGTAISWQSKLQSLVALSTTEAEYIAAVETGKDVMWMRQLLGEFGMRVSGATELRVDNQSAISVTRNPEHHGRMKHLNLRYYWLRDVVETGAIWPVFVPTHMQVADIFTKALPRADIERFRGMLGLSA